jgi:hypothetical protein
MSQTHTIAFLADHPQFVDKVGGWIWEEWDRANGWTREACVDLLRGNLRRDRLDITLIAMDGAGDCIGCIEIMRDDWLEGFRHLSPWVGCFYVAPPHRRGSIALDLWNGMIKLCEDMKIDSFHAHSAVLQSFLTRRGGLKIGHGFYSGKAVDVFQVKVKGARIGSDG